MIFNAEVLLKPSTSAPVIVFAVKVGALFEAYIAELENAESYAPPVI